MTKRTFLVLITIFLLKIGSSFAYQKEEKFKDVDDYQFLANKFYENEGDSATAAVYANTYLLKAKRTKDTLRIADGYYFLSSISKNNVSLQYSDSIIAITKYKKTKSYPVFAYLNKANVYFNTGNFKRAFDYFLKVEEEATQVGDLYLLYSSKRNIGILKAILGENETALETLRECYVFYSKNKTYAPNDYLYTLFALSESYNFNKVLDSATMINTLGYTESTLLNKDFKPYFILNEGINQYTKKNFNAAKDSLTKSIKNFNTIGDMANLGQAHFYLGKTLSALGFEDQGIAEHKKVSEIFQKTPQIIPESRESYEILIEYYKKKEDRDNQLKYIERLIKIDSVLNSNYKYLIKNVVQNYDTPRLLSEKQEIIDSLKTEKKSSLIVIILLIMISLVSVIFWIFNHRKKKKYRKRFEELYSNSETSPVKKNKKDIKGTKESLAGISDEIIQGILQDLKKFEQNKGYLKPNIMTNELAKKMNTNSKYLSKVVNHHYKKSISLYINELRINYCIEKVKTDKKFMNYTVKAIARECGFNSTDAFSKSFYKIKGIQPSYFIRELEKKQKKE